MEQGSPIARLVQMDCVAPNAHTTFINLGDWKTQEWENRQSRKPRGGSITWNQNCHVKNGRAKHRMGTCVMQVLHSVALSRTSPRSLLSPGLSAKGVKRYWPNGPALDLAW